MSKIKGQQHRIETQAFAGLVTVSVSGESIHTSREANGCAELLAEALNALKYEGEYKVIASMQRLKGSSHLQGLSTKGVSINAVLLGYQPNGNDSRATYTLQLSSTDEAQKCFVVLKEYFGTAYTGESDKKPAAAQNTEKPQLPEKAEVPVSQEVFVKPTEKPEVYYTKDSDWMDTFIVLLSDIADKHPEHQVTKDQVLDLIVERTHYDSRFGTATIFKNLLARGHLLPVEGVEDVLVLDENPPADFVHNLSIFKWKVNRAPAKSDAAAKVPKPRSSKLRGKSKYLDDTEWMKTFVSGLQDLVKSSNGLISKTDLYRFVKERTNQKKIAGTVYKIVDGLQIRGKLTSAGEASYRFVYAPPADIVGQGVAAIERARAEVAQVFEGFAKTRLPDFAEGIMQNDKQLLREFLQKIQDGVTKSKDLQKIVEGWYPGMHLTTYIRLFDYLVGQGYLVRPKRGTYVLGPNGHKLFGLQPLEYKTVEKIVDAAVGAAASVLADTSVAAEEPLQAFVPKGLQLVGPVEVNTALTGQIAKIMQEAAEAKKEAEAAVARKSVLCAQRDALKEELEKLSDDAAVEAEVQRQLISLLD